MLYEDSLVSSGDSETPSQCRNVIGTCPCLGYVDGIPVCLNGRSIQEVELFNIHPELIPTIGMDFSNSLPICYGCVRVGENGVVHCASQGRPIIIRSQILTIESLEEALASFPRDMFTSEQDICSECLYKVLTSLVLSF